MLLVVQLAHERMDVPPLGRFTPWTTVGTSTLPVGPERITHVAPASICLLASSCFVNKPVHSKTSSTPRSRPAAGERSVHCLHVLFVTAVDGVVLDEVRHVLEGANVVHGDQLQFWGVQNQLQRRSSDTAETV